MITGVGNGIAGGTLACSGLKVEAILTDPQTIFLFRQESRLFFLKISTLNLLLKLKELDKWVLENDPKFFTEDEEQEKIALIFPGFLIILGQ